MIIPIWWNISWFEQLLNHLVTFLFIYKRWRRHWIGHFEYSFIKFSKLTQGQGPDWILFLTERGVKVCFDFWNSRVNWIRGVRVNLSLGRLGRKIFLVEYRVKRGFDAINTWKFRTMRAVFHPGHNHRGHNKGGRAPVPNKNSKEQKRKR